jgi:hypothetical protein
VAEDAERLRELVLESAWLVDALTAVRESGLPDAWVGAGVLRDLVWGELFGHGFRPAEVRDIDVVFYDADDLSGDRDRRATEGLKARRPGLPWEACNQAAVHTWYAEHFGGAAVPPLRSIAEAVATWPETATAVAVRLDGADDIQICAPLGPTDLVQGVWRRNPARVSLARSRERLARHRPAERWPGIRVVPPA